jgi:hypothetical protein
MPVHSSATIALIEHKIKVFQTVPDGEEAVFWFRYLLEQMLQENNDALVVMERELGLVDQ